ncbi:MULTISPECIES: hypothetical protein [unclassified Nocardiopsis]|uniref:hypothetical protein n=1 Tax=unclassified Nocardiopsis TaxID=2649073 RepID=UPI0013569824|nr:MULTISPECIES: hypothetical protein [unclassified Nocardiopsis]
MQTGLDVLQNTAWDRTFHAYGSAADAPAHLLALAEGDDAARTRALDYLHSAILHQGTLYPATPPVALCVAGLLDRPSLGFPATGTIPRARGAAPVSPRAGLLEFLTDVAVSATVDATDAELAARAHLPGDERERLLRACASDDELAWLEPGAEALLCQAVVDLRAAAPALAGAVHPFLTHGDPLTRIRAVEAAGALARMGGLDLDLSGAADMAESRDEGAVIVLALGGTGGDTSEFLSHADPAIRACAALAPAQSGNPAATAELAAALADPAAADAWFTTRPALFGGHVRFTLVRVLAERSRPRDAERLLPVLAALAPLTSTFTAAADAGPLLSLAFAEGGPDGSADLTGVQRAYLRILCDHEGFWDGRTVSFQVCLKQLGLPVDRAGIRALLGD